MSIAPKQRWSGRPSSISSGEQDHPGAGAEHGHPVVRRDAIGVEQARRVEQPRHGGALAAGEHERVDTRRARRACGPDGSLAPSCSSMLLVCGERALEREDADRGAGAMGGTSPDRRTGRRARREFEPGHPPRRAHGSTL
jgi:hypothetical protein